MAIMMIYGSEPYRRDKELSKLIKDCEVRYSSSLTDEDISWLSSFSFTGKGKKLVISIKELGADEDMLNTLSKYPDLPLVLLIEKAKENTKIFKYLKSNATIINASRLNENELTRYISKRLSNNNIEAVDVIEHLVAATGYLDDEAVSLYSVNIFIAMLLFEVKDNKISNEAIDSLNCSTHRSKSFDMINALGNKDYNGFVKAGVSTADEAIPSLSLLLWAFRVALKEKLGVKTGASPYTLRSIKPLEEYSANVLCRCIDIVNSGISAIKTFLLPKAAVMAVCAAIIDEVSVENSERIQ